MAISANGTFTVHCVCLKQRQSRTLLTQLLSQQRPTLLWIRLPGLPTAQPTKSTTMLIRSILELTAMQLSLAGHVVMESAATNGRAWNYQPIDCFIKSWKSLKSVYIRACNIGTVRTDNKASARLLRLETTLNIQSQSQCACGRSEKDHIRDANSWIGYNDDDKLKHDVETHQMLLKQAQGLFGLFVPHIVITSDMRQPKPELQLQSQPQQNTYPTEARLRQKEKHKLLQAMDPEHHVTPKRRHKEVEQRFDDCGEDTSSLDIEIHMTVEYEEQLSTFYDEELIEENIVPQLSLLTGLFGSELDTSGLISLPVTKEYYNFPSFLEDYCAPVYHVDCIHEHTRHVDVIEISSGAVPNANVLIRRFHYTDSNRDFDISVECDLTEQSELDAFWFYMETHNVRLAAIMLKGEWSPQCPHQLDLCQFGGNVANYMISRDDHHFISELPANSNMYLLDEWLYVRNHPRLVWTTVDHCMTGLRDHHSGLPQFKSTEFWASDENILAPLSCMTCDGQHEHDETTNGHSRLWTCHLACSVAAGIANALYNTNRLYFPEVASGEPPPSAEEIAAAPKPKQDRTIPPHITCKACRSRLHKRDVRHTRDPIACLWPETSPF